MCIIWGVIIEAVGDRSGRVRAVFERVTWNPDTAGRRPNRRLETLVNRNASDNVADEATLVSQAQAGDHEAFAALMARYQDRVFNTCYRMCHNHADALDLTQTAFLKAFEALPRFDAPRTILHVVVSHRRECDSVASQGNNGGDAPPR